MGNPVLRDDAVGVRLAAALRRRLPARPDVEWVEECSVGGLNLLDVVVGFDRLVALDSIQAGGPPGSFYSFSGASLRRTLHLTNVHDANFATALELGRRVGLHLPPDEEVHVFAVEVADAITFDERMSEPLELAFPELVEEIAAEVERLLG